MLIAYPIGKLMESVLPTSRFYLPFGFSFTLNPGPFNFKEHAMIYIFSSAAANPCYALYNIVGQRYKLGQTLSFGWALFFALATQCFGYGLAGMTRRLLVRPASMLWPSNLSLIALLNSLHIPDIDSEADIRGDGSLAKEQSDKRGRHRKPLSRFRFFWIVTSLMFVWTWFPSFIMPVLSAVSLLCYAFPNNSRAKIFGSANQGVGILSFTFDWSVAGAVNPITTPLWALLNQIVGCKIYSSNYYEK